MHFVNLQSYDLLHTGFLSDVALEKYVNEAVNVMGEVQKRTQSDLQFGDDFIDFAIAHLLPPLDPLRTGAVALPSLLHSPIYHQFIFSDFGQKGDTFHPDHVNQDRSQFNALDLNRDGLLEPADLQRMHLTGTFARRLCDILYSGWPLDFKWFVVFMTTWESIGTEWANTIIFEILDIDSDGVISDVEVLYFWKDMSRELRRVAPDKPIIGVESFVAERFDAFGVSELAITKEQFVAARGPHVATFVKLLADIAVSAKEEFLIDITRPRNDNMNSNFILD
jgi:Ca2+-binding EF-hand superfamily protein